MQSVRKNIGNHLQQYMVYHAQIQAEFFTELKRENEKISAAIQNQSERIAALEQRAMSSERQLDSFDQRLRMPGSRRERLSDQQQSESKLDNLEQQTARLSIHLAQLQRKMDEAGHTGSTSAYGSDTALSTRTVSSQQFDALNAKVTELDHTLDRCLSSSLDQELRLQLLERATYSGVLLWKIDDFSRRRREAVEGITLSLYSTPFYTSPHGYKMCARIYLNGDGLGKGTHLSFFFVIMRGPYDALLTWPFNQKVMLTLLNQSGKKHVTDHFRPDPHSSSFECPGKKEMNIASGCPLFIRIEHLMNGGFIKDDCIFLRVVVDISDLPKIVP